MTKSRTDENLREEFNRWAESGKGESMEHEHWPITKPALGLMQIEPTDNILDLGCGAGWLSRILAHRVAQGRVVGMDISDEMIQHAREASVANENLVFVVGSVDEIPWEANFFTRVDLGRVVILLARSSEGHTGDLPRAGRRRLRVDSHQLLP